MIGKALVANKIKEEQYNKYTITLKDKIIAIIAIYVSFGRVSPQC